ncbi:MAG: hopanoid biosynthesis-associated RND transporter HpnN, partial [Pseudomonadota bacterium]|nr:hopanoid biosynthesis-associated RND transporter HpnN [Pseudomonadota bacterium]
MPKLGSIVPRAVATSIVRPFVTLLLALLVAAGALLFTSSHFAMTTDTAELISPNVDWRQHERAMDDAFPQLRDAMLVVIDGQTPELAEDGAAKLAAKFAQDPKHFRAVRRPDGGDFLAREGALFGSEAEVRETVAGLVKAQPLFFKLSADPSLR